MKVKRLEFLQALKFIEKDAIAFPLSVCSRAKDESYVLYSGFGKRITIDCDQVKEQFIPIAEAVPRLLKLLPTLNTEYFEFDYENDSIVVRTSKEVTSYFSVLDKDGEQVKRQDGTIVRRRRTDIVTSECSMEVTHWENFSCYTEPAAKGNFIVQLDENMIATLRKAKEYLSTDEYNSSDLCNFIIHDSVLYATDKVKFYAAKFHCSNLCFPSYLADAKYTNCKIYKSENDLYLVSQNWEMKLDAIDYPTSRIKVLSDLYNSVFPNQNASYVELDAERLSIVCNIALIADKAGRFVLNLKNDENGSEHISLEVLNDELVADIPSIHSYSDITTMCFMNARIVLLALQTLQIPKNDFLRFNYVRSTPSNTGFCFHIKLKDEVVVMMCDRTEPKKIQELKQRIDTREERFKVSGWSSFYEFQTNNYKTREEVELEDLINCKKEYYENAIRKLVPIRIELVQEVQQAQLLLAPLTEQYNAIVKAFELEYPSTKNGKESIALYAELDELKQQQVSPEITVKIETINKRLLELTTKRINAVNSRTKFLSAERSPLLKIVNNNQPLLKLNIDQVANSNSHILAEREALQKEYDEFLLDPAKYVRTTKQVAEELKGKKGKKKELLAA